MMIVGASVRAAAQSAAAAGLEITAIDLFGDFDLAMHVRHHLIASGPSEFERFSARFPATDWIYTGALENQPRVIEGISRHHTLLGNDPQVIQRVRDPFELHGQATEAGFRLPSVAHRSPFDSDGDWLRKPFRSASGNRISPLIRSSQRPPPSEDTAQFYYQRRVRGQSISLTGLACRNPPGGILLGCTEQLVGCSWCAAGAFSYCGSVGPFPLREPALSHARDLIHWLAVEFHLVGLFGVDAILNKAGFWILEVNPRFSASAEIVEKTSGVNAIQCHINACRDQPADYPECRQDASRQYGKAILFAQRDTELKPSAVHWLQANRQGADGELQFADIPSRPQQVIQGHPVMTVLAEGTSRQEVIDQLKARLAMWEDQVTRSSDSKSG